MIRCNCTKIAGDDYFKHLSEAAPADFDPHTTRSFFDMVEKLNNNVLVMSPSTFQDLEQSLGLSHNPHGILWSPISQMCDPTTHVYWDWQHIMPGSGGVCQYEINLFVHELKNHDIEPSVVDDFQQSIQWPSDKRKCLPDRFFQDRVVWKPNSHIKAFASEVLAALQVLVLFMDRVLARCDFMQRHCDCMRLLCFIIQVLQSPTVMQQIDLLRRLVLAHRDLYRELYGFAVASKPKLHYLFHVIDCIERHGLVLNCFAPERKHKSILMHARVGAGVHLGWTILKRVLLDHLQAVEDSNTFQECYLLAPKRAPDLDGFFRYCMPGVGQTFVSTRMVTRSCEMRKGDLVSCSFEGRPGYGLAMLFACGASMASGRTECFALVRKCLSVAPGVWTPSHAPLTLVRSADLSAAVPFVKVAAGLHPLQ